MDLYGIFCFVPAEDDATAMLAALSKSNEEWGKYYDPSLDLIRPLDVSKLPFNRPLRDVIVLHPRALLPDGLPLGIVKDRFFYLTGQSALPTSLLTWTLWTPSDDCLRSNLPPYDPLAPFVATDVRAKLRALSFSSLAMVIKANCKSQKFMQEHGPSVSLRVKRFSELMSELVEAIFFVPDGLDSVAAPEQPLRIVQRAQSIIGPTPSQAVQAVEQSSGAIYIAELGPAYGEMEVSTLSSADMLSCAIEPPRSPTHGLTDTQFRLVSTQVIHVSIASCVPMQRC